MKHRTTQKNNASLTRNNTESFPCGSVFRSVWFSVKKVGGFTVVEVVIYAFLLSLILVGFVSFTVKTLDTFRTLRLREQVLSQGQIAMSRIAEDSRDATRIYTRTSTFGATMGQLSFETTVSPPAQETRTYIDYYVDNGVLYRKAEGSNPVALTGENIAVDVFTVSQVGVSAEVVVTLRSTREGSGGSAITNTFRTSFTSRRQTIRHTDYQPVGFAHAVQAGSPAAVCDQNLETAIGRIEGNAVSGTSITASSSSNRITGNAMYGTVFTGSGVVDGTKCQIGSPGCPLQTLPALPPVDLQFWQDMAAAGGTCISPECQLNGDFEIDSVSASLGPKRITRDLDLRGSAILTLTGPLWVNNNVEIDSTSRIRLHPDFASRGTVIVADGAVHFTGATTAEGTGGANSGFILFVSKKNGGTCDNDIDLNGTGDRSWGIFYAPNGEVELTDTTRAGAVAAQEADMWGSSTVARTSAMGTAVFTASPLTNP